MADGLYQSAICYFMAYLLFEPATFEAENGRGVADRNRMGVYVACVAILVINTYILMNTYRWDWIMLLITAISILLIWAWTGIYTSFQVSFQFYRAGSEVYGTLTFWALTLLVWIICLLPRFTIKSLQKSFKPYDIDIVREQVRQGKFKYLDDYEAYVPPKLVDSSDAPSEQPEEVLPTKIDSRTAHEVEVSKNHMRYPSMTESQRPIYPPSEAPTRDTRHLHSQTDSDGTDRTGLSFDLTRSVVQSPASERVRPSSEQRRVLAKRPSLERVQSSFERSRESFDKLRATSFESSPDFPSAALLSRVESTHSQPDSALTPATMQRMQEIGVGL